MQTHNLKIIFMCELHQFANFVISRPNQKEVWRLFCFCETDTFIGHDISRKRHMTGYNQAFFMLESAIELYEMQL